MDADFDYRLVLLDTTGRIPLDTAYPDQLFRHSWFDLEAVIMGNMSEKSARARRCSRVYPKMQVKAGFVIDIENGNDTMSVRKRISTGLQYCDNN